MSLDTQMRNEWAEQDGERIRHLESQLRSSEERARLLQEENLRLSGKTGFCAQCEAYAKERDAALHNNGQLNLQVIRYREALEKIAFAQGNGSPLALMMVARKALSGAGTEGK